MTSQLLPDTFDSCQQQLNVHDNKSGVFLHQQGQQPKMIRCKTISYKPIINKLIQ